MKRITTVVIALVTFTALANAAEIKVWEPFEIDMAAKRDMSNPYTEALPDKGDAYVKVTFTCQSGQARGKTVTVAGFWDGGKNWKVRFAPPAPGKWSYMSVSKDKGLDGVTGTVTCTEWTDAEKDRNPARRGPVRVCKNGDRAGRYFEYADGTPFLWIADTWWNWTRRGIKQESFKKLADDRAAKGFSVGQLFFAGRGWSGGASMLELHGP